MTLSADHNQGDNTGDTTLRFKVDGTERGRFDDAGLDITGSITIPDATITNGIPNNAIKIGDATDGDLMIYHDSNNSVIRDAGTGSLIFQSNQIVGYRYGTAEKLFQFDGLGAASLFHGGASTAKLATDANGITVDGRVRLDKGDQLDFGDEFRVLRYTSQDTMTLQSPEDVVICIDNNANGSTNHKFAILKETTNPDNGTGTELFKVEETGNATLAGTVTCTSLTETSDIALKENIQPLSNVLDKVKQLTGYRYNFKDNEKASMGVIAQDVEKVFPELVHGEEGEKSLQYSGLVGALIEAVK